MVAFFEPSAIADLEFLASLDEVIFCIKLIMLIVGLLLAFDYATKRDAVASMLLTFWLLMMLTTSIAPSGSLYVCLSQWTPWVSLYGILKYSFNQDVDQSLRGISTTLFVLLTINLLTVILFPFSSGASLSAGESGQPHWFLGHKNLFIVYIIIACFASMMLDAKYSPYVSVRTLVIIALSFISVLLSYSATSIVVVALLCFLTFVAWSRHRRVINPFFMIGVDFGLFIAIVLLRLQSYAAWLIEGLLGKSVTFTGRTTIWDMALLAIGQNPVAGVGVNSLDVIGFPFERGYYHAHDQFLNITYQGGLISVIPFLVLLVIVIAACYRNRAELRVRIISIGLACCLLFFVFDFSYLPVLVPIVASCDLRFSSGCSGRTVLVCR